MRRRSEGEVSQSDPLSLLCAESGTLNLRGICLAAMHAVIPFWLLKQVISLTHGYGEYTKSCVTLSSDGPYVGRGSHRTHGPPRGACETQVRSVIADCWDVGMVFPTRC